MGKIFDALEKFSKESGAPGLDKIRSSDYEVLMQFDKSTGRIDMHSPAVLKDAGGIKRLMTYRLINDNGTLTPAGKAKYEEMKRKHGHREPPKAEMPTRTKAPTLSEASTGLPEGVSQSDWALIMNYDRKTGNLLKYDPETGQMDEDSRNILQDPDTVQRLIDNQMILPGGWLTPEARQECARMEEKSGKKQLAESVKRDNRILAEKSQEASEPPETLSPADMELLLQHDPATRKLDMRHEAFLKDPAVVKRLLNNKMIEADGKLTPQALVRCRALKRFRDEHDEKASLPKKAKPSIGEKLQAGAQIDKVQKAAEKPDKKNLKIISIKKDEIEAKDKEEKTREVTHDLTAVAKAREGAEKPAGAPPERKFTLGKAPVKYARREIEKDLVTLMNPHSFEAEQFKILRTNLLFAESGKTPRSVMVTSAAPGEGKSFVAANLAVSVAQHVNWNVLLIDCDLRRPNIHRQFGFQNVSGLSDYLANGTALEPLLRKTGVENLTILPAGPLPDNPSELLSSKRMAALLDEVANRYKDRLIILDSPPPRLTAESGALARYVDGILLVVKYGKTPKDSVTDLIDKLGRKKIIGAVVNNFDAGASRYNRKYYGGEYFRK